MSNTSVDNLLGSLLEKAALRSRCLKGEVGCCIVVTEFAARVIALFDSDDSRHSFLWLQPGLIPGPATLPSGVALLGGDRVWLAPERDFFFPAWPDTAAEYEPPPGVDPGRWLIVDNSDTAVSFSMETSVKSHTGGGVANVKLSRRIFSVANPVKSECEQFGVSFAGFGVDNSLTYLAGAEPSPAVALWSLLQLPHGGVARIPLLGKRNGTPSTRVYFGEVPSDALRETENGENGSSLEYTMTHTVKGKVGVHCASVVAAPEKDCGHIQPCAVRYMWKEDTGKWCGVIKAFFVAAGPAERFIDVPPFDVDSLDNPARSGGDSVQFCCFHGEGDPTSVWKFSEVEHHALSINMGESCTDSYEVYAFRGNSEASVSAVCEAAATAHYEKVGIEERQTKRPRMESATAHGQASDKKV